MLKFLAFTDFHYEKMRFSTTVEDLTEIIDRARENEVDFVIHAGDFCGDFNGSVLFAAQTCYFLVWSK